MQRDRPEIYFATSNVNKFLEAQSILAEYGLQLVQADHKRFEIQSDSIEEVARESARSAASKAGVATLVEDAGLFVDALRGFPGPYSSFVHATLGCDGILKLLNGISDRKARFVSAVAFCEPDSQPKCFSGVVEGAIVTEARGMFGFGFDPIFVADGAGDRTFGEMQTNEKNRYSHRAKAFREFARWFVGTIKP